MPPSQQSERSAIATKEAPTTAPKDDALPHLRTLSQPMAELLVDPVSDLTRKRQVGLLIAATIAMLLSGNLITITEIGVASAKFSLAMPGLAKWLASAVTAYLLIAYLLGVWADWTIAKAKRWSSVASIADVKAAMFSEQQARMQAVIERKLKELDYLQHEEQKITAETERTLEKVRTRLREIKSLSAARSASDSSEGTGQHDSLAREAAELERSELAAWEERKYRLVPVRKAISDCMSASSLDPASLEESDELTRTFWISLRLTRLRRMFEIIFPSVYAVFALAIAALAK